MMKRVLAIALFTTSLIVAGCSSDDDDVAGDSGTTDGTTTGAETDGVPAMPADDPGPYDGSGAADSIETFAAANTAQFSTLLAAVTLAGDTFSGLPSGDAPGTLFAPTNAAFEAAGITEESLATMDAATVAGTLNLHVVPTIAYSREFLTTQNRRFLVTAGGNVAVTSNADSGSAADGSDGQGLDPAGEDDTSAADATDEVTVGGVALDGVEVLTTNGIVHAVNSLLTASADTATDEGSDADESVTGGDGLFGDITADPELTSFAALVSEDLAAMLDEVGNPDSAFTVFAPTNDAVAAADLSVIDGEALDERVLQHVVRSAFGVPELEAVVEDGNGQLPTLAGTTIAISGDSLSGFVLDGSIVVTPAAAPSANGFIHKIDTVLMLQ